MIRTVDQLRDAVAALPEPPQGKVRVFRGQPRDYGAILPSGLRRERLLSEALFSFYVHFMAVDLRDRLGDTFHDVESYALWVRAIAQHYGPGSRFLDVTHSLDIALWFALHSGRTTSSASVFGPQGPIDQSTDRLAKLDYLKFEPNDDGQGSLYVLDVPAWDGTSALKHGTLIDLEHAPWLFAESPRIRAQSACLLFADSEIEGGDLSQFVVGEPLSVHQAAAGVNASLTATDLFPGPDEDEWYGRFLSLPLVNQYDEADRRLALAQPIPVTLHLTDAASTAAIAERLIVLEPPVERSWLKSELKDEAKPPPNGFDPARSVPILLELPVFAMTPPLNSGQWDVAVATSNLPKSAETRDVVTGETSCVALDKVFVEFSPLELLDWDRVERSRPAKDFRRGAQVEIRDDGFDLFLVEHTLPSGETKISPRIHFARDDKAGLVYVAPDGKTSRPLTDLPFASKTLLVVLTILRELASETLACPFPLITVDQTVNATRIQGRKTTHLLRVPTGIGNDQLYLLRDSATGNPFAPSQTAGIIVSTKRDRALT